MTRAFEAAREAGTQTILVDEFLKDAIEVDVDCVADGKRCVIGGVMQHIEEAGVHSGDSSSVLPPHSLPPEIVAEHRGAVAHARARARRRGPDERAVRGEGRRGLHPRGQPAREPHGAVRLEGDGRVRSRRSPRCSWWARRSTSWGSTTLAAPQAHERQGERLSVREVPGRRHHPRAPRCARRAR